MTAKPVVYVLESEASVIEDLGICFAMLDFQYQVFSNVEQIRLALKDRRPAAIIVRVSAYDQDMLKLEKLELLESFEDETPKVFTVATVKPEERSRLKDLTEKFDMLRLLPVEFPEFALDLQNRLGGLAQ